MEDPLGELREALERYNQSLVSTQVIFEQIADLFLRFRHQAESLEPRHQQLWLKHVQETLQTLVKLLQPYLDTVSISEPQLLQILDDPSYFIMGEWRLIQKTREQVQDSLQKLAVLFLERPEVEMLDNQLSIGKKRQASPHPGRSDWMKS